MPRAIRIHETGGPGGDAARGRGCREARRRRSAGPAHGHRREFHRRLRPQWVVSAEDHARRPRARGRRCRHRAGQEGARFSRRRSRRVRAATAGFVLRAAQCAGGPTGQDSGRRSATSRPRCSMLKGMHRLLSVAPHLSREDGRRHGGARRGRWCRPRCCRNGARLWARWSSASSAAMTRRCWRRRMAASTCWCAARMTIAESVRKLTKGSARTWCTTASARTPSSSRSIACAGAA